MDNSHDSNKPVAWINAKGDMTYLHGPYNSDDRPLIYGDTTPPAAPVADGLIRQYITALVANKPDEAANATKGMVDYVYTTPPAAQRQWVGLTDEELRKLCDEFWLYPRKLLQAIEAKLRAKNFA
jgi:hypothetical protein